MAGLDGLTPCWGDTTEMPPEPEAQGPALGVGAMRVMVHSVRVATR